MGRYGNIKMAIQSLKAAKWRSFLTMLGVIIGVVSVVTTVSLGEGVKQQIRRQGQNRGQELITVSPGQQVERDSQGRVTKINPARFNSTILSDADYQTVKRSEGVDLVAPLAPVVGLVQAGETKFNGHVIATTEDLPALLNQPLAYGSFFDEGDLESDFAVVGTRVAEKLFQENIPIGKSFTLREETFVVRGVFEEFDDSGSLGLDFDYNNTIMIPYDIGRELMGGNISVQQIMAKPESPEATDATAKTIRQDLLKAHAQQEDFTVLTQEEALLVANSILNILTAMIAAIAGISLFVGGIGIMNIMFVAVIERTNEIGIRKAVGATNQQVLSQFLTEAAILGLAGGVIGVMISLALNFCLRVLTDLQPVITLPIVGIAVGVAWLVGVFFGVTPALRAARKDPIEALRYE